jgi:hypothetical protein
MKDWIENFLTLCKGMMQPLLTIVMAIVFFSYAASSKFSPDQVWQVVVGVIVFWFGYTAFKFGTGKDESPKANSPIVTGSKVSGLGAPCYDYDNETVSTGFSPVGNTNNSDVDKIIQGIFADLKADGITADVASVSARIVSYLGAHGDELDYADLSSLIDAGINYASTAYTEVTGLKKVPLTYAEVADFNRWWRNNKAACKAPAGQSKAVLMTLRDLLNRKENI